jgi:hypothetical protein
MVAENVPAREDTEDLLREVFWRSSMRLAIVDRQARIVMTSKAFRDAFPTVIDVADGWEVVELPTGRPAGYSSRGSAVCRRAGG